MYRYLIFFIGFFWIQTLLAQKVDIEWNGSKEDLLRLIADNKPHFSIVGSASGPSEISFRIRNEQGDSLIDVLTLLGDGSIRLDTITSATNTDSALVLQADGTMGIRLISSITDNFNQAPNSLSTIGIVSLSFSPQSIFVSGRYAYVTLTNSNKLVVIDVSDPSNPSIVGDVDIGTPESIYVSGRYAYIVESDSGKLRIIDVSKPSTPIVVGTAIIGTNLVSVYVSGHYAYVLDRGSNELKVVDVSDPNIPIVVGSVSIGTSLRSVYVSGPYSYIVDNASDSLKVVDITDPKSPKVIGGTGIGTLGRKVVISGRHAYVLDSGSDEMKVIDVSNPCSPVTVGNVSIGPSPIALYISGRYVYVVDNGFDVLKVIDVISPSTPQVVQSYDLGSGPRDVYVSGKYIYVIDTDLNQMQVIEISGIEATSMIAHSMEAGNLQVRNDIFAQGQLQISSGASIGPGGINSDGNIGLKGILSIASDSVPGSSPPNRVQLYTEDVGGLSELKVRDEAGNITTLSPHNFSLLGGQSEPLAWSYFSENQFGRINVDMLRVVRQVEQLSGEKLVYSDNESTETNARADKLSLREEVQILREENNELRSKLEKIMTLLGL